MKCFKCNDYGHIAQNCKKESSCNDSKTNVALVESSVKQEALVEIKIKNEKIQTMVDTGSPISFMREDVFSKHKTFELHNVCRQILGFGDGKSIAKGRFEANVMICNREYILEFYVVPADSMKLEAIIGRDVLSQAELTFDKTGVTFKN